MLRLSKFKLLQRVRELTTSRTGNHTQLCDCPLNIRLLVLLGKSCQLAVLHMKHILKFSSVSIFQYLTNVLFYFIIQQINLLRALYLPIAMLDLGEPRLSRK